MITHALTIIANELTRHLALYGPVPATPVDIGNIAEGLRNGSASGVPREVLALTVVNIKEEKALKNLPNYSRDEGRDKALYANPPVFINLQLLVAATHANYGDALQMLSRAIRFFQLTPLFTETSVDPGSLTRNAPVNALDKLGTFRIALDLYSPTLEEVNYLWGTLGGRQYPFVLYMLRLLELRFQQDPQEAPLIAEVQRKFDRLAPTPPEVRARQKADITDFKKVN